MKTETKVKRSKKLGSFVSMSRAVYYDEERTSRASGEFTVFDNNERVDKIPYLTFDIHLESEKKNVHRYIAINIHSSGQASIRDIEYDKDGKKISEKTVLKVEL